jgi:4'-phosphopantetheinyl transferase EntD
MTALLMPTLPVATSPPSRLEIAGCAVDLAFAEAKDPRSFSAIAARLAEQLVAARLTCDPRLVRVAALMPTGRPMAMLRGVPAPLFVSLSHTAAVVGAAVCPEASVGLDIVAVVNVSPALDAWFCPEELAASSADKHLLRQRLWSAKEAAYKAAHIDAGFRPHDVRIEDLSPTGFHWQLSGPYATVCGVGSFAEVGGCLIAVAVPSARRVPQVHGTPFQETPP